MSDLSEAATAPKPADHMRTLHEKDQEKRLIVVLEKASLETVKVSNLLRSLCSFLFTVSIWKN